MFIYIQHRANEKKISTRRMCATLPVSESGYYKWKRNRDKPKAWRKLLAEIHKILDEDEENSNYGVERMMIALEQKGIKRSFSTVKRAMAHGNLLHEDRRSPDGLTKADRDAMKPQNIIKQDFTAEAPLRKFLTDITQIPCKDAKLYVSFGLLQRRNRFSCHGHEHEKGTLHENNNGGIQEVRYKKWCDNSQRFGKPVHEWKI